MLDKKILGIFQKETIFYITLLILVFFIPISKIIMSITSFLLIIYFLINIKSQKEYNRFPIIIVSIFLFSLIVSLSYSIDIVNGINQILIILPIIIFPILISGSNEINKKRLNNILLIFVLSTLIVTLYGFLAFHNILPPKKPIDTFRSYSQLGSHIRLNMYIQFSIFILIYQIIENNKNKIIYLFIILWFIAFLILLQSVSAFMSIIFVLLTSSIYYKKYIYFSLGTFICLLIIGLIILMYNNHNSALNNINPFIKTESGNLYNHDYQMMDNEMENGSFCKNYICETELRNEWNKRSKYKFDTIISNIDIDATLIRYLTSKSLRKDSAAISNLSDQEVINIENGKSNYLRDNSIINRVKLAYYEMISVKYQSNPFNMSITQRYIYLKEALYLIQKNIFGYGIGDYNSILQDNINKKYNNYSNIKLPLHNQLLSFAMAAGIFSVIIFIIFFLYLFYKSFQYGSYLFVVMLSIMFFSFFYDDTLKVQEGVYFFSVFYSLFLLKEK